MDREDIVKSNEKYFKFYLYLPMITTIILGLFFFILGIEVCSKSNFGYLLLCWLLGTVACILNFILTKLSLSYKILHIYYLQELRETNQEVLKKRACLEKQSEEEGSKKALD